MKVFTLEKQKAFVNVNNTKSSIRHANAPSLPYTQHIRRCRKLKDPLLKVYSFYYGSDGMSKNVRIKRLNI